MLSRIKVDNVNLALIVAYIRNTGRQNMTHYQNHITEQQQEQWWNTLDHSRNSLYLYHNTMLYFVGFGMLKLDYSDRLWATLVVLPEFRGFGFGTEIYRDLIALSSDQDLWIEVLNNNKASLSAAVSAGFQYYTHNDVFTSLVYKRG